MAEGGWFQPDFQSFSSSSSVSVTQNSKKRIASSSREAARSKKKVTANDQSYVHMFKATKSSELIVQKKKLSELKQWLEQAFDNRSQQTPILLLSGPPGCGKYQSVTLISKELGIDIHQWEEPIRYKTNVEWEYNQDLEFEDRHIDLNPLCHLSDFMLRTNRYSMLPLKGAGKNTSLNKKLLLVKDLPAMVYTNLEQWHQLLMDYCFKGKTPVVFILTEGNKSYGVGLKLFPTNLQEKLFMSTINFNSLPNTFIAKALERVLNQEKRSLPSNCQLSDIVESSNGDLRSALNTLQLMSQGHGSTGLVTTGKSKKRKLVTPESKTIIEANSRDGSLDFLHALGKILYCKRPGSGCPNGSLPAHLKEEERVPLQENVDTLVGKISETSSKVLLYLHQNYPPFFSNVEDIARATHYLSSADLFSSHQFSSGNSTDSLEEYAHLTSIRGLMHSNTNVSGSSWRPLKKPEYYLVQQKERDLRSEARELWPLQIQDHFFSERLPYLHRMMHASSWTPGQMRLLEQSSVFQSNGQQDRTMISAKNKRTIFRTPQQPEPATLHLESRNYEEDEEILVEEYDD